MIVVPEGALPPCHTASFNLRGTLSRAYYERYDGVIDYGWDLTVTSDIEPLLGCTFVSAAPGNSSTLIRGDGRIGPDRTIGLAFSAIYACTGDSWWIVAGAGGQEDQ
jgi:hypothetical protein